MILKCLCAESYKWARSRRQGRRTRIGRNGSDMPDGDSIDTVAVHGAGRVSRTQGAPGLPVSHNTVASPVHFPPVAAGFDLCLHSGDKYLGGHSDLAAGAVMGSAALIDRVRRTLNHYGGSLDPHAGFLLARGVKTLALRVRAQNENAMALAGFLAGHPEVAAVGYPGLASHPDHAQ